MILYCRNFDWGEKIRSIRCVNLICMLCNLMKSYIAQFRFVFDDTEYAMTMRLSRLSIHNHETISITLDSGQKENEKRMQFLYISFSFWMRWNAQKQSYNPPKWTHKKLCCHCKASTQHFAYRVRVDRGERRKRQKKTNRNPLIRCHCFHHERPHFNAD